MTSRTWTNWLLSAVVSGTLALGIVAMTSDDSDAAPPTVTASVMPVSDEAAGGSDSGAAAALAAVTTDARFSISVLDIATGEASTYGAGTFDTASIVKVDILAALLWQHQQAGTSLTQEERRLATAMIEQSDNAAATALFDAVGGEAGLESFNELIGLTGTDVASDGAWGLTQTTADDQVRLLQVVLGEGSVLDADARTYARGLMTAVVAGQRFGVSAAADDPGATALKVGYLQRSTTGLWDVTSIGEVEVGGHTYLVAVLTDGNASFDAGVSLADEVARLAVGAMTAI